ncbi:50S ribosomal protein L15 [Candidatus Gracilibacteria bacterium]|nr:50S ribosomal protein L15 [Candidatus Gracilibacteria bacterium]MCF7819107.1 50S ribosomal protein L15 [Candidatus Gracilibacteria bacterium]
MELNKLAPKSRKYRTRRGQGNASGKGTFSGRGCKGQNARSGGGVRKGFEGGQTPLIQRIPKKGGFRNPNRIETQVIHLSHLEEHFKAGEKVHFDTLVEKGLVHKSNPKVKILGDGELSKKLEISGLLVSQTAQKAIEKAGGNVS